MTLLDRWTEQEEIKAGKDPMGHINLDRKQGRLYHAAGFIDAAIESLEQAAHQAKQNGNMKLHDETWDEIGIIEGTVGN